MRLKVSQAADVRLGRQRSPKFETGDHQIPYLRSANIDQAGINLTDVKSMNFTPEEQLTFRLEPGDVLVTEGSGSRATVGMPAVWEGELAETVCFQNTLLRLRPRDGITDGRYLAWWARHAHASGQMAEAASGANILHLGSDGLKHLEMHVPVLDEQRRIADFLNDRVSRIDSIVEARREQGRLTLEEAEAELNALLTRLDFTRRPLQSCTDPARPIQYGIVLPGPDFDGGVPIIKGGDIGSGRLKRLHLNRTDPEIERGYVRSRVRPGDLVIAIRGSVGEIDRVPDGLVLANLTQDSARIAPRDCDVDWLLSVLETAEVQASMTERMTGSTVRGINIAELRRVPIPVPLAEEQGALGRSAITRRASARRQVERLEHSIDLLTEYKRSLVAAAVTGRLDVTTASKRVPA